MKLYFFPVAPNPTRVRLFLAEKAHAGHPIALEEVSVDLTRGEQRSPEHRARHPLGKLPVLELDDGTFLTESTAIVEYLEETHPGAPMLGRDPIERARVRELDRQVDLGVLMAVGRIVHATNSPLGLTPNPPIAEAARGTLDGVLPVLDAKLADGRPFLAGEAPSVADCTLAAAFQFARFGKVDLDPAFTHLAAWDTRHRARPPAHSILIT